MKPLFATTTRRAGALAPFHEPDEERLIDILIVSLKGPAGETQIYGLLASQVHSIVRLDGSDSRLRQGDTGGWELAYEDDWIPVRHLRTVLRLPGPALVAPAPGAALHILSLRFDPVTPGEQAHYFGLLV